MTIRTGEAVGVAVDHLAGLTARPDQTLVEARS